jgi:DNA-binding NarL/FixJ family response regulator
VSHILRKLKVADRTGAVVEAVRLGLISIPPAESD